MKKLSLLVICGLLLSPSAFAKQCYSQLEMQAEQLLRLHSELMVVTLTCKTNSDGRSLVPMYTGFTNSNIDALREAEQTMIRYYGKGGVAQLDRLRTRLGNEFSLRAAKDSTRVFCAQRRDKVTTLSDVSSSQLNEEVLRMATKTKAYGQACGSKMARVDNKTQ